MSHNRKSATLSRCGLMSVMILYITLPECIAQTDRYAPHRARMVATVIEPEGINNRAVLQAMSTVPRHEFVPAPLRQRAYHDVALPIGSQQTISSPFIVAYMTQTIDPRPEHKVLEIGTGSGYQAAVLAEIVDEVYSVEIVSLLAKSATKRLKKLGYKNVHVRDGDGYKGWEEHAPFDSIIVTCSPESVPAPLADQLKEGGRMIIPLGERYQQAFYLLRKTEGKLVKEKLVATLFVPMTGQSEDERLVKPDPLNPTVVNGDFEYDLNDDDRVDGWHYQRQVEFCEESPMSGKRCLRFESQTNDLSQALQGGGIDGNRIAGLDLAVWARTKDIIPGSNREDRAGISIHFYDHIRREVANIPVATWRGTGNWQQTKRRIAVPRSAREMVIRIGLNGARGQLDLDDFKIRAVRR